MTPRTDAQEQAQGMGNLPDMVVPAYFARQLETELAAARAELDRAMRVIQVVQDMHDSLIFLPAPVRSAVEEWEAGR